MELNQLTPRQALIYDALIPPACGEGQRAGAADAH